MCTCLSGGGDLVRSDEVADDEVKVEAAEDAVVVIAEVSAPMEEGVRLLLCAGEGVALRPGAGDDDEEALGLSDKDGLLAALSCSSWILCCWP